MIILLKYKVSYRLYFKTFQILDGAGNNVSKIHLPTDSSCQHKVIGI